MAITTLDGVLAGSLAPTEFLKVGAAMEAAGVLHSLFYTAGNPGAAVAPSPGINGAALTTYAGQLPFSNPASGNTYLGALDAMATLNGSLVVCDRLWHNSGIAVATLTAQAIVSPTWPSRCPPTSGLPTAAPTTDGHQILVGIEASTATTNAGVIANTTLNYTNSAGTAGRTGTISWPATAVAGTFVPFNLMAGDVGVRSVQGITLGTSYGGGAIHLVAFRKLMSMGMLAAVAESKNAVTGGFPRLYDSTVPFLLWLPSAVTATTIQGAVTYSQG